MVTYVFGDSGRGRFSDAFARDGLRPRIVISTTDADTIKTCVREGLGIGVIADLAYDVTADADLGTRDLTHLFTAEVTRIAYAREKYLRGFQHAFIELFQRESPGVVRQRQHRQTDRPLMSPPIR
jgi:LysR family cys regulon transcriptional activator